MRARACWGACASGCSRHDLTSAARFVHSCDPGELLGVGQVPLPPRVPAVGEWVESKERNFECETEELI